jgi:transcriptional regulator with XRE-family HTH domain
LGKYTKFKKVTQYGKRGENKVKPDFASVVAANLKKIREEKEFTMEQMAELLGYSISGYRKIELGDRGLPIKKAVEMAEALQCSLDDIFLPF